MILTLFAAIMSKKLHYGGIQMAGRKRNINLFLMDGEANGIIKITSKPWNGLLLRIPRNRLYGCGERDEMKYSSIYFLVGPSDSGNVPSIYVGQVGMRGILKRLTEHDKNPDKKFWTEAIVLTTNDNGFGATELNYLEHTFYRLAVNSKQCVVKNAVEPTPGNINEETESEIAETVELTQIILEALGYKIFTSPTTIATPALQPQIEEPVPAATEPLPLDKSKKIGKFVYEDVVTLLNSGRVPAPEIQKLTSLEYCKNTFKKKINYPVLVEWPDNIDKKSIVFLNGNNRYYSDAVILSGGKRYLISSQWYKETYDYLVAWYMQYHQ